MIEVKGLVKDFAGFLAVDQVSFSVPKGQVLGFLGPNGAGKSTTMKMMTCYLRPTAGTATIGGKDIINDSLAVRELIGYLPESAPSYGEMTVTEFLTFVGEMRLLQGKELSHSLDRIKDTCFLESVWDQPIETLSKGYKQRVGFAQALIHDPPVLILDEPTDGLDPNQKHEVRQMIRQMGKDKTIVLSTHILEEVEAVCDRVVIIANGKKVADETPENLLKKSPFYNSVILKFRGGVEDNYMEQLKGLQDVEDVESRGNDQVRIVSKEQKPILDKVAQVTKDQKWDVDEIFIEKGRLDEVFRKLTM